jgi:hypothetical protein
VQGAIATSTIAVSVSEPRQANGRPDWLYTLIVSALGIYFIVGAVMWAILAYDGRSLPDSFATILATIAGGLVGVLTHAGPSRPPE